MGLFHFLVSLFSVGTGLCMRTLPDIIAYMYPLGDAGLCIGSNKKSTKRDLLHRFFLKLYRLGFLEF